MTPKCLPIPVGAVAVALCDAHRGQPVNVTGEQCARGYISESLANGQFDGGRFVVCRGDDFRCPRLDGGDGAFLIHRGYGGVFHRPCDGWFLGIGWKCGGFQCRLCLCIELQGSADDLVAVDGNGVDGDVFLFHIDRSGDLLAAGRALYDERASLVVLLCWDAFPCDTLVAGFPVAPCRLSVDRERGGGSDLGGHGIGNQ